MMGECELVLCVVKGTSVVVFEVTKSVSLCSENHTKYNEAFVLLSFLV